MVFPAELLFVGPSLSRGTSPCPKGVFFLAVLFLASIISSSDVSKNKTNNANNVESLYATGDSSSVASANSSTHTGAVSTAATTSIGAEVVDELGCADTEFRLTCRELDSTIAILDARFYPFDGTINADQTLNDPSPSPNETVVLPEATEGTLPCAPPKEWLEAGQWARFVGPDGAAVVDPSAENESLPWPLQPGPGEYHFRLALNHRCSGVNHCSFILASDFQEAGRSWGPGAVRIRYACMRHGHHLVRYCNENIVAGATTSKRIGDQWHRRERRRRGRGGGDVPLAAASAVVTKKGDDGKGRDGEKKIEEKGAEGEGVDVEEEGREDWGTGEGFIASPGYPKYYIGGGPKGGDRKACEWVIRPRQPGQRVQVTLLDVSLRGVAPLEQGCSDWVVVTAVPNGKGAGELDEEGGEERILLTGCGEAPEAVKIESPEEAPGIRIALLSNSEALFPKRGILFHYKALGCRWPPPSPPKDGYLVSRNSTAAQYMCCVGFRFPDSGRRERELHCDEQRGIWRVHVPHQKHPPSTHLLPDCIDGDTSLWAGNGTKKPFTYLNENSTSEKTTMLKDADFMLDVLVPSIIIGVLLLGNGVILYIIFQFKKRKLSTEVQEEELRISQNGLDTATGRPSDV